MFHKKPRRVGALVGALLFSLAASAAADIDARSLQRALGTLPDRGAGVFSALGGESPVPLLVHVESRAAAREQNLISITDTLAIGRREPQAWQTLLSADGILGAKVGPQRALQLDQVARTVKLETAHNDSGLRGEGSIIGVLDTGADPSHPAFLDAGGNSRIAWFLAFGEQPRGLHPELEEEYGCLQIEPCAVLSADDINEIIASGDLFRLPRDRIGHGTHVTSLAAGRDTKYPGIAPLADLIIVSALSESGGVSDARILLGTKFIFDRATEMGRPAVVNLSLGSSFGAHDGTSSLEVGLSSLAQGKGRAIVIASGNSATTFRGLSRDYPEPLGVHTEVAVLPSASVRVPFLSPTTSRRRLNAGIFIWLSTRPGEQISVGFSNGQGSETPLVKTGASLGFSSESFEDEGGEYEGFIVNGIDDELEADVLPGSVVIGLVGKWSSGRAFELVLQGHANARMWIMGTGDAMPGLGGYGPLFPRARSYGTVAVPGSHRSLITVGSTVNRVVWEDYLGRLIGFESESEGRSPFSGAGPNQVGAMKPELVAPGGSVIGAMGRDADPRTNLSGSSQFSSFGTCPDEFECLVIDDQHGIASGTSMSAPLVAGAVALLMQRDPELTMEKAKRFLMAGAAEVQPNTTDSMVGAGQLDLVGALLAQERDLSREEGSADAGRSRVVWAEQFAYPSPGPALEGYLLLKNSQGEPISLGENQVEIRVEGPGRASWDELAAGLIALRINAGQSSASQHLIVTTQVNGQLIRRQTIAIERDPTLAEHGFELMGGTCTLSRSPPNARGAAHSLWLLTGWFLWWRRRLQHQPAQRSRKDDNHAPHAGHDPGQTDARAIHLPS